MLFIVSTKCEIINDRAVRSIVAVAALGQLFERTPHRLKLSCFPFELRSPREGQRLNIGTRPFTIMPKGQKHPYLFEWEAQVAGAANEAKRMNVALIIVAIT